MIAFTRLGGLGSRPAMLAHVCLWLSLLVPASSLFAQGIRHCPCHECRAYRMGHHHPVQKGGRPEAGAEQERPQGYAAPQPTGTMAGPTQGIGFEGCEIELPTLKIRTPSIRIPALTRYHHPARMLINSSVAPLMEGFRREYSLEAGEESEPVANPRPEGGEGYDEPQQKRRYHHQAEYHSGDVYLRQDGETSPALSSQDEQLQELLASKRALEDRMDQLHRMLELLVIQQSVPAPSAAHGAGHAYANSRAVQPSHFVTQLSSSPPPLPRPTHGDLPPTSLEASNRVSSRPTLTALPTPTGFPSTAYAPLTPSPAASDGITEPRPAYSATVPPTSPQRLPQTNTELDVERPPLRRTPPVSAFYR